MGSSRSLSISALGGRDGASGGNQKTLKHAAEQLGQEKIDAARRWFDEIDTDKSGGLDEQRVLMLMRQLVPDGGVTPEQVEKLFSEVDVDGSGDVRHDVLCSCDDCFVVLVRRWDVGGDVKLMDDGFWTL